MTRSEFFQNLSQIRGGWVVDNVGHIRRVTNSGNVYTPVEAVFARRFKQRPNNMDKAVRSLNLNSQFAKTVSVASDILKPDKMWTHRTRRQLINAVGAEG